MAPARTLVSAAVVCYVNGKPFGRVSNFKYRSQTNRRPIYGIDSLDPYELAIAQTRVSGTMQIYRTISDGGAEGAGITANYDDLPREKYFSLQLVDRGSDRIIFQADLCSVQSQDWIFPVKGIVTGVIEWEGISWSNEIKSLGVG